MSGVLDVDELVECAPEQVCVLTEPVTASGVVPRLCSLADGQVAALVHSSAATALGLCGTGQPWRWMRTAELPAMAELYAFDVVLLDVAPPGGLVHPEVAVADTPDAHPVPELTPHDLAYLPSRPVREGDREVWLELQPDDRGRRALLVYTSVAELVAGCGPYQSWAAVPAERLAVAAADAGAEIVLFNPTLSEAARHTGPVRDWHRK